MSTPTTLGPRGQKISSGLKWAMLIGAGFVLSKFIFAAITGLIGIGVFVVLYTLGMALAPVVSLKLSNFAMKHFIAEVRANPVESRLKLRAEKAKKLEEGAETLKEANTALSVYSSDIQPVVDAGLPEAKLMMQDLQRRRLLLAKKYEAWATAQEKLKEFDRQTENVRIVWNAQLAGDKMNKAMGKVMTDSEWDRLIETETIKAANDAMASSFAELDHLFRMENISEQEAAKLATPVITLQQAGDGSFILPALNVPVGVPAHA